jgi:WD40 repeat protein
MWLFAVPTLLTAAATEPPAPSAGPPLKVETPDVKLFDQTDLPKGAILRIGSAQAPRSLERSFNFSPDGKYIAAGTVSRHVRIWEVATGKVVQTFGPFDPSGLSSQMIAKSVFSADGKMLAVAAGKLGHVFDLATGKELGKLEGHTHIIEDIAFSKDGKRLVTAAYDQTAALWDRETFKRLHSFPGFANAVFAAAVSDDGSMVAAADYKGVVKLWKAGDGTPQRDLAGLKSMAHFLRFSADGKTLLAAGHEDGLVAWDVANGEVKRRVADMKGLTALSTDGALLAAVKDYASTEPVVIWDVQTGKPIGKAAGNYGGTAALGLAPDNRALATYGGDGILRRWNVKTGEEINRPDGHQDRITGVTFTRDGKSIISSSEDGTVRFWEAATGKETRRLAGEKEHIHTLALSPDGKTLALVGGGMPVRFRWQLDETRQSSSLRFFDLEAGNETRSFHLGGQTTGWARFSPDGREIFALGHTGARFIDVATGKERSLPIKVEQGMPAGDISLDGRYAAISTNVPALRQIGKIAYIDLGENKEVFSKTFYLGGYSGLAFTPDGKYLAVAGSRDFRQKDEKITPLQLWEVPTDKVVRNFEIGDGYSRMLTFSRDGRMLAAVQNDRILVFEVATGKRRFTFTGHEGNVGAVAFSRDGRRLVSGGEDCRVLVWDLMGVQDKPIAKLEPKDLDRLWNDLATDNAPEAVAALGQLSARPAEALPYLRLRLTVLAEAEIKRIEALVADLDNDQFRVRDKAAKDLERLGEAAVPVLKRALASRSTEVRQTAERLLKKIGDGDDPVSSPEARRVLRAIEALERIGDADAQTLLKDLRRRGGKLIQHREADAALKRLEGN